MQSVTAIICRERDATVDDIERKKKKKKGEEKKKRLYEGGKARERNGLNSGRPFIASASWILCGGPRFFPPFFHRVTRPVKTRHTSHISLYHNAEGLCMNARHFYACKQTRNANYVRWEFQGRCCVSDTLPRALMFYFSYLRVTNAIYCILSITRSPVAGSRN